MMLQFAQKQAQTVINLATSYFQQPHNLLSSARRGTTDAVLSSGVVLPHSESFTNPSLVVFSLFFFTFTTSAFIFATFNHPSPSSSQANTMITNSSSGKTQTLHNLGEDKITIWRNDDPSNQADQIPTACSLAKLSIQRRAGTP
mmetsp:Transcript_10049/g.15225  ORF Transcript_10049/g.15225 Transcript_10049/m.15225 type:complete len:144 (-) Transcript_10049:881-1312(-)